MFYLLLTLTVITMFYLFLSRLQQGHVVVLSGLATFLGYDNKQSTSSTSSSSTNATSTGSWSTARKNRGSDLLHNKARKWKAVNQKQALFKNEGLHKRTAPSSCQSEEEATPLLKAKSVALSKTTWEQEVSSGSLCPDRSAGSINSCRNRQELPRAVTISIPLPTADGYEKSKLAWSPPDHSGIAGIAAVRVGRKKKRVSDQDSNDSSKGHSIV